MNAMQFIKEHGVEKAREVIEGAPDRATTVKPSLDFKHFMYGICEEAGGAYILLSVLKSLVLRLDLIDRLGGINNASELFVKYQHLGESCFQEYLQCSSRSLEQAIADYESIYSDN